MANPTSRDYRKVKHPKHTMQEVLVFVLKHPPWVSTKKTADALGMAIPDASKRFGRLWKYGLVRRRPIHGEVGRRNMYEVTDWGRKYATDQGLL